MPDGLCILHCMIWNAVRLSDAVNSLYVRMSRELIAEFMADPIGAPANIHSLHGNAIVSYFRLEDVGNPLHQEAIRYCEYNGLDIDKDPVYGIDPDQVLSIILTLLKQKIDKNPRGLCMNGARAT